jgi:hypothetical protein
VLLMGGQACIFHGAAEFSRDIDVILLLDDGNVASFWKLLSQLQAAPIAVPPFELDFLRRGPVVHFRCRRPELGGIRLDIMTHLRGVDLFPALWDRRTPARGPDGETYELLSLPDLVLARKTQRDKDWPMIRRLVEADYFAGNPTDARVRFWLRELRSPDLLVHLAEEHPALVDELLLVRPLLAAAASGDLSSLGEGLAAEEREERSRDRAYWLPLRRELEELRRTRRRSGRQ